MSKRMIFIVSILQYTFLFSQEKSNVFTELLWLEDNIVFYTTGEDTFMCTPGFVSYDPSSNSISANNYIKGYYRFDNHITLSKKFNEVFQTADLFKNDDLMIELEQQILDGGEKIKKISFNKFWEYTLCIVTFQKSYVGKHKHSVPKIFNKSKALLYEEKEIPIYFIKILSIVPYEIGELSFGSLY